MRCRHTLAEMDTGHNKNINVSPATWAVPWRFNRNGVSEHAPLIRAVISGLFNHVNR